MRTFNVCGPNALARHYTLPPLARIPDVGPLLAEQSWFVVHAPRQSGKTTVMRHLAEAIREGGRYAAVYASLEGARAYPDDPATAMGAILGALRVGAESLPPDCRPPVWPESDPAYQLRPALRAWSQACPKPLVLILDEVDSLEGPTLLTVLSQLREGFSDRPQAFPSTVVLCGMRDVRDYRLPGPGGTHGASPFNVKVASFALKNFRRDEVSALVGQHAAETGQVFPEAVIDRIVGLTGGQPWLVNALAREIVTVLAPAPAPIDLPAVEGAKVSGRGRGNRKGSLPDLLPRFIAVGVLRAGRRDAMCWRPIASLERSPIPLVSMVVDGHDAADRVGPLPKADSHASVVVARQDRPIGHDTSPRSLRATVDVGPVLHESACQNHLPWTHGLAFEPLAEFQGSVAPAGPPHAMVPPMVEGVGPMELRVGVLHAQPAVLDDELRSVRFDGGVPRHVAQATLHPNDPTFCVPPPEAAGVAHGPEVRPPFREGPFGPFSPSRAQVGDPASFDVEDGLGTTVGETHAVQSSAVGQRAASVESPATVDAGELALLSVHLRCWAGR